MLRRLAQTSREIAQDSLTCIRSIRNNSIRAAKSEKKIIITIKITMMVMWGGGGGGGGKGENDIIIVQITSILSLLLTDGMQRTLCPNRNLGVWQIVSNKKFVNDKLVSGKLSKVLLNERLLVHNFQNNCSTEYH